jgi:hypothetical protein
MNDDAFFHEGSESVRFWVQVDDKLVGASVRKSALHFRFTPNAVDEDPMATFRSNRECLEDAVRRRVAGGSLEPIMLREPDLPSAHGRNDPVR